MVKKIIKFSATWCGPCRVYRKTFEAVSNMEKYKDVEFIELDADDNEEEFENYNIKGVPTTALLDENDNVISTISGNISQKELTDIIDSNLDA